MKDTKFNENAFVAVKSIFFTIATLIVLEILLSSLKRVGVDILPDSLLGNVLLEAVIFIVQFIIVKKYSEKSFFKTIGFKKEKNYGKKIWSGVAMGLLGSVFMFIAGFVIKLYFYEGVGFSYYSWNVVLAFVLSLLVRAAFAGFCEEVFFRGVLLSYLSKYKGKMFGLIFSSIIFMIFHCTRYQSISQLLAVLTGGILLGYVYIVTRSLYMSVGIHIATDFFSNLASIKGQPGLVIISANSKFTLAYLTENMFILTSIMYVILLFMFMVAYRIRLRNYSKYNAF
ncbi:type II CAAX endopeptidase family protein [Clostridium sp. C8-1-8]|uniref:CPBP family intramembrane glutamic endopeptidase n=1 Tax=Clostridium sp. C8-1-8 TaxID=2698831 RepID=UPI00136960CE|nr:type II CAAX endopeptidase family protein [Clostridium sp. C8-1-8]